MNEPQQLFISPCLTNKDLGLVSPTVRHLATKNRHYQQQREQTAQPHS
jgi:hypothetical protein